MNSSWYVTPLAKKIKYILGIVVGLITITTFIFSEQAENEAVVISLFQRGGQTANTIYNFAPEQKTIEGKEINRSLLDLIKQEGAQIYIRYSVLAGDNAAFLAQELSTFFSDYGKRRVELQPTLVSYYPDGITLIDYDLSEAMGAFNDWLNENGIKSQLYKESPLPQDKRREDSDPELWDVIEETRKTSKLIYVGRQNIN